MKEGKYAKAIMAFEALMPQLGLTMEEGTVSKWIKHEGDAVKVTARVEEITGKGYDPQYIRDCAKGRRRNISLQPGLNDLLAGLSLT